MQQHHELKHFVCFKLTDLWPSHALFSSWPRLTGQALGTLEVQNRTMQVSMGECGQCQEAQEISGHLQLHKEQGRAAVWDVYSGYGYGRE